MFNDNQEATVQIDSTQLTNVKGFHWIADSVVEEGALIQGLTEYYSNVATKGLVGLFERSGFSITESLQRLNFARSISSGRPLVNVFMAPKNRVIEFELDALQEDVTLQEFENWLSKIKPVPYSAFITFRAAMNTKFMESQKNQRGRD